ncbi:50S ribosomal protein L17 [candidate division KSB1 bacterium]|nr:50S ribosomal protein L17 [candidate division KSB1 bacterium]NIR70214.1 50S ribosomal protein L17 [candidate division KSB1 bacterium]NIS26485.1 50S ribosomal protein L17 [candidate division KSB1 bacterium]NIT73247.1 50S ribosomal protein L17 [candidate division KSB1 bacterium]NIU23871.1 50S ribosomal protein L17 [candidate division KSB1 bacterium]
MRHKKVGRKLGRTASHRRALFANVASALFKHKQIKTTTAKARQVRKEVDKLITFAKRGTVADRRQVLRRIDDKNVVKNLFDEIAPAYQDRNGGYTRVIKLGRRQGDGAQLALLELVGFEGVQLEKQKSREEAKAKKEEKKKDEAEKEEEAE